MENEKYNGWSNYETWNVKLWLDNDAGSQELQQEWLQQAKDTPINPVWTREQTTKFTLEKLIEEFVYENNPLADQANMYADLIGAALGHVDYREIAENIMSDN